MVLVTLAALATETMAGRDRSRLNSVVPGQQQGSEAAIIAEPWWISGTERQSRGRVYEFLQVDASAHIKMEPCMQPNLFYCDFYQYFMKLKEYSLKSENLED